MAYNNVIGILIAAKDEASSVIGKAAAQTKLASAEINGLGSESNLVGASLKGGLVVGLIAVAGESANLAIRFQQSMEMLHTNAGVAQKDIAGLSQQLLNMSGSVGQGPEQLAQAFYHIASAGTGIWDTAKQLDILKVAAMGAAIGQASLDDTTYALTSAMASNIGGVKNAAEMMAVLNATVGAGDMKLKDLNGALSTGILSTAATFGISIQSVGSALATLTDNGEHADEAATRLRMTLALMSSPSSMATKQLEALGLTAENAKVSTEGMNAVFAKSGLTTTKLADDLRKPNGIAMAIEDLKKHLNDAGLSASEADAMLSKAFGGGRTDAALLTLLQNTERLDEKFKVINSTANDFSRNYTDQQTTAAQKIRDVWATVQVKLVEIGTWLGKVADVASKYLTPAFQMIGDAWNKYIQPSFDRVIGANGDKIISFFATALVVAISLVVIPLVALGATFAELVVGINYAVQGISNAWNWLRQITSSTVTAIINWFTQLPAVIGQAIGSIWGGAVSGFSSFTSNAISWAKDAVAGIVNAFLNLPNQIGSSISGGFNKAKSGFDSFMKDTAHNVGIPGFALGTNFAPGGMTMVGENGPELVNLPTGSKVHTVRETAQMSQGSGASMTINGGIHVHNEMDEGKFLAKLGWRLSLA